MDRHHRTDSRRVRLALRDGASSLALELSLTRGTAGRSMTAQAQCTSPAGGRATAQSSSGQTTHCLAQAETAGRQDRAVRLHGRLSGWYR
jgi:hypothetical protein